MRQAERALGKAVHPDAIARLFELWPDAHVEVKHELRKNYHRFWRLDDLAWDPQWVTRVTIWLTKGFSISNYVFAEARCHPDDRYDRRKGIEIAFRRALAMARRRYHREQQEAAYRKQGVGA